ncbi:MAG TPA: energy transducer TonB [Rhizomicrobium sp.]|nr:energy transducer TonB [Rhizomicrobium sp.]
MERPAHLIIQREQLRPAAVACALVIEFVAIYLIATGLAIHGFRFFPQAVQVDFLTTPPRTPHLVLPELKLVPPPTPDVVQPDIQIQTPKPAPHITVVARAHPHPVAQAPVQIVVVPAPPAPPRPRGITAPVEIGAAHSCEKRYPAVALRLNQEGMTTVRFTVNADGTVSNVRIAKSSGHQMLDEAAIGCATAWRYRPALEDGRPVTAPWTANVQWKLKNGLPA